MMKRNFTTRTQNHFLRTNALAIALLAAAGGISALTFATNFGEEENKIRVAMKLADAPPEVQTALRRMTADSTVTRVWQGPSEDMLFRMAQQRPVHPPRRPLPPAASVYEIEYTKDGAPSSVVFSAAGDVIEVENKHVAAVPPAARRAMEVAYPKANFDNCRVRTATYYEMDTTIDGEMHEVTFDAAGNIADFDSKYVTPNDPMQKGMIPKK